MSYLLDESDVEYPKTVTRCHEEISRLQKLLVDADSHLDKKEARIEELQGEIIELEDTGDDVEDHAEEAIHAFLDECERVAPLKFDVPQSERANRAIVRLHDAVGRKP
jgi:Fe-S-cluster formation regulator IscX/YfhJ